MASRKQRSAIPAPGREFKLRVPEDIAARIEKKAKAKLRPMNRILIDELAEFPDLEKYRDFGQHLEDMKIVLARYSARIIVADLTDELIRTLREIVKADDADNVGVLRARVAKVRTILAAMEKTEKPKQDE